MRNFTFQWTRDQYDADLAELEETGSTSVIDNTFGSGFMALGVGNGDAQGEGAESRGKNERDGVDPPVACGPGPLGLGVGRVARPQHRRGGGLGPPSA